MEGDVVQLIMKIYASLGTYLQNEPLELLDAVLDSSDRPILVLENNEVFSKMPSFLIPLEDKKTYEIGFPLVSVSDWDTYQSICQKASLKLQQNNEEISLTMSIKDLVLDSTQVNEESTHNRLSNELTNCYDRHTAETIAVFIGLFQGMRSGKRITQIKFPFLNLPEYFQEISSDDARLPLVVSLDRRYELRHKLESITTKLRSQLNRTVEMIPLARIQEMDAYCLRDYVRRPGRNAIEKAGARQELLGIKRFQNFNTPENRFLKGFCELLHLECQEYNQNHEAELLGQSINYFRQDETVQTIQKSVSLLDKPNYVLEQNPIYRSFYQAYLDYVHRLSDKEKLWSYRQRLCSDAIAVLIVTSFLYFQGSYASALSDLVISDNPHFGRYLENDSMPIVQCFLQNYVVSFQLNRSLNIKQGDWLLTIKQQKVNSLEVKDLQIPIWIFWYRPSLELINKINFKSALLFYLYEPPEINDHSQSIIEIDHSFMIRLPDLKENSLQRIIIFLNDIFRKYLRGYFS